MLASGQIFTRADERSLTNRTVTLAVTPEQVDTLVAARSKGAPALSLRGLNDQQVVARPKPKSAAPDPMEKRWKLEEERRKELERQMEERRKEFERQMEELKAALAKKLAEPPPRPSRPVASARRRDSRRSTGASHRSTGSGSTRPGWRNSRRGRTRSRGPNPRNVRTDSAHRPRPHRRRATTESGPETRAVVVSPPYRARRYHESQTMKDVIRIALVDPSEESRDALRHLLNSIPTIWVAEIFTTFQEARVRIGGIAPDVTIVALDHDPDLRGRTDRGVDASQSRRDGPAGEPQQRQQADPPRHPRRGPRVSHAPRRSDGCARDHVATAPVPRRG